MRKNGLSGRLARLSAIALGVLSFGNVGADALGDDLRIGEPLGLTAEAFGEIVRAAGGYVPTRYGLQVDMNGDFVSVHCIIPGHYDFALPFAAEVTNLKTGERQAGVRMLSLDLVGGETRWYALR